MFRHLTRFFARKDVGISKEVLEKSSNTNLVREMSPDRPGRRLVKNESHVIVTLDPKKFSEKKQQLLHIGNLQSFRPCISPPELSSSLPKTLRTVRMSYDHQPDETDATGTHKCPYPPDTRAFLYYSMSPEKPRIAGELRLRVALSDDEPATFESGSDLLLTNGQPWSRPLYVLPKSYFPLYEKLRKEGLVPDDLDTALSTLPSIAFSYRRSNLLYSLNDASFIVDFSNQGSTFLVITEQGVAKITIHKMFYDNRETLKATPYTGSALVRFERSTLPDHKGTRTVVLRFLKMITHVKCVIPHYDGYICHPKEGELHRRNNRYSDHRPTWSVNIDNGKKSNGVIIRGLQLLWDA